MHGAGKWYFVEQVQLMHPKVDLTHRILMKLALPKTCFQQPRNKLLYGTVNKLRYNIIIIIYLHTPIQVQKQECEKKKGELVTGKSTNNKKINLPVYARVSSFPSCMDSTPRQRFALQTFLMYLQCTYVRSLHYVSSLLFCGDSSM